MKMPSECLFLVPDENASLEMEWLGKIQRSVATSEKLHGLQLPPREKIIGSWFLEKDLGFIFAPRGMGKTWFAMNIAVCISEGRDFWDFEVPKARRVLYIDGEMAVDMTKERHGALSNGPNNLLFLHHELLFHETKAVMNLTSPAIQQAILRYCLENKVEVVFLDNLSCLFSGVKENDADSWEQVSSWLLDFRRNNIAVVIIHHAGRNGEMRGTSRREDAANWVIQLTDSPTENKEECGAHFMATFVKNRNTTDAEVQPFSCIFKRASRGIVLPIFHRLDPLHALRNCVENLGLNRATDIAEEIGMSKGQVSKLAKKAIDAGWLEKDGRDYRLRED